MIAGFRGMSLLDYPGMISAIVFTQGCVFRCAYCHNPTLIPRQGRSPSMSEEDVLQQLRRHRAMVDAVCITGGEPTLQHDLPRFIRLLKSEGFFVKLDTNGVHPVMIEKLIADGLVDYFAMDLKHTWERYDEVARTGSARVIENCKKTFSLIQLSHVRHEFRTTVYAGMHTEDDLVAISGQLLPGERYVIQPIRYGATLEPGLEVKPALQFQQVLDRIHAQYPEVDVSIRA